MMTEPTPEMIAMARQIAADLYPHSPGERALILDGSWDRTPSVRAALAAIQATTDRTLTWLEAEYGNSANNSEIPLNAIHMVDVIRRCIRDGEHLKEQSNAE